MDVIHGDKETPLNAVKPCEMGVISSMTLDMYGSSHLIISNLLKDKQRKDLESKSFGWIGNITG